MRFNRRQFFRTTGGVLAYATATSVLTRAGIAQAEPIRIGNILDKTGVLNIYSLKQISGVAMAVDEINAAGGLLGRPAGAAFLRLPVGQPVQQSVRHAGAGRRRGEGDPWRHHQFLARGDAADRATSTKACSSTTRSTRAASAIAVMSTPAWCRRSSSSRLSTTSSRRRG